MTLLHTCDCVDSYEPPSRRISIWLSIHAERLNFIVLAYESQKNVETACEIAWSSKCTHLAAVGNLGGTCWTLERSAFYPTKVVHWKVRYKTVDTGAQFEPELCYWSLCASCSCG